MCKINLHLHNLFDDNYCYSQERGQMANFKTDETSMKSQY